jgi:hypothetical protein
VGRVNQAKLHSCYRASISVGEKNPLLKSGVPAQAADFRYHPLPLGWNVLQILLRYWPFDHRLIEQFPYVCVPPVPMQQGGIHGIGDEHVGAYSDCDFFVALAIKAQAVLFGLAQFSDADLD